LSVIFLGFEIFPCLIEVLIALGFVVSLRERFVVCDKSNLLGCFVDNLFIYLFSFIFLKDVKLDEVKKLLFFLLVNVRFVLVMDDRTVLSHS
jgi:hypothetical protein